MFLKVVFYDLNDEVLFGVLIRLWLRSVANACGLYFDGITSCDVPRFLNINKHVSVENWTKTSLREPA